MELFEIIVVLPAGQAGRTRHEVRTVFVTAESEAAARREVTWTFGDFSEVVAIGIIRDDTDEGFTEEDLIVSVREAGYTY